MKLYATTTSERASKGQGGNNFLEIEIHGEKKRLLGVIKVLPVNNGSARIEYHFAPDIEIVPSKCEQCGNKAPRREILCAECLGIEEYEGDDEHSAMADGAQGLRATDIIGNFEKSLKGKKQKAVQNYHCAVFLCLNASVMPYSERK